MSNLRVMPSNVIPIWTPQDSVDTAQEFALEIDNAERGSRLMSQSRFRKAKIMDGLAVALLMALMAALGCAVLLVAAPKAKADPDPISVAYAAHYADAVCWTLRDYPTINGVLGIIEAIKDDGLTAGQAGAAIGLSVAEACPRYEYVLDAFIARYGSVNA